MPATGEAGGAGPLTGVVTRAHGGGGIQTRELIHGIFARHLGNPVLDRMDDAAVVPSARDRLALTTDSYVVDPWSFPGGNIGDLAVCGTVNDLAMVGAEPRYLTAGFILPEGFPLADLDRVAAAMAARAAEAGVAVVAGDTKVVGAGAGPFVNTAGVGVVGLDPAPSGARARPGDVVLLTGDVGRHGIAVLSVREGIGFATAIESDVAPLNGLVATVIEAGTAPHVLRDCTRGGVAGALNEIAEQSAVEIEVDLEAIPVEAPVRSACDLLGYDPLHVANEGCALVIVAESDADRTLTALNGHPLGGRAARIGRVFEGRPRVVAVTALGGRRLVDAPAGELLPRIC